MGNFTGYWVGELEGTNQGGFAITIQQNGNQLTGSGRFLEHHLGYYEYKLSGTANYPDVSIILTPQKGNNPLLTLGNVEVNGKIDDKGEMKGRWKSSVGTEGIFKAHK